MKVVLDAAALLCVLLDESGAEQVIPVLRGGLMSAVNVSEADSRGVERGLERGTVRRAVTRFEIVVVPFDLDLALAAADLRDATRAVGASLGDRACLALARVRDLPLFTADRRLGELKIGIDIRLIR